MTPVELKQHLDRKDDLFVLDVREPFEYEIANIGATLIPLGELPNRAGELDKDREIVVHCKTGGRSQKAAEFLAKNGFKKVWNLAGGITGWANDVDPSVPKY
jgi:adenylyltransferase/sulfurtransferase